MRCNSCFGKVLLDPRGYYVCSQCGKVIEPYLDSSQRREEALAVRTSKAENWVRGSSSTLHFSRNYYAWYVLGKVSAKFNINAEARKRLVAEYEIMARLAMHCSDNVKKSAIIALLVHLEHRRRGQRANLKEIVRIFKTYGFKLELGDIIKAIPLAREAGLLHDSWDDEVEALLEKVGYLAQREVLKRHVAIILDRIKRFVGGRSRRNVAAAVVVLVLWKLGVKIDLFRLSRILQVPYTSLRSNIILLESLLLEVGLEHYVS